MKVSDILRVKGGALHTTEADRKVFKAVRNMTELDLGSMLVTEGETMVGILTFRR